MVKHVENKWVRWVGRVAALSLVAVSAGCSAEADPQTGESVGISDEAMSQSTCAAATANGTYTGGVNVVSPTSYNTCGKAYVVDVNNMSSQYTGHGNCGDGGFEIDYKGPTLAPADCVNTTMRSILYHKVGSSWTVIDDHSSTGVVGPFNECMIDFRQSGLVTGNNYRVAATVRDVNNNVVRVGVQTVPRCNIQ